MPEFKRTPTVHHRRPKSKGGGEYTRDGGRYNISMVQLQYHRAWHLLFKNKEAVEIAEIISNEYLDPDYVFICVRRPDAPPVKGE